MRIVLETGVLVSGVLSPHGAPAAILRALLTGRARLCYDERILSDYRKVLTGGACAFDEDDVGELLGFLEASGERTLSEPMKLDLRDPEQAPFAEVARAGGADCLVAERVESFPAGVGSGCSVVTAEALAGRLI